MIHDKYGPALVIWAILLLPALATAAEPFTAKVVRVKDGDTIVVLQGTEQIDVRLDGIDCPESGQPFGQKAKQAVSKVAFGKTVTIRSSGTDRYGRTLGVVILPDDRNLNQALVQYGYAWWYRKYSDDQTLAKLEAEARKERRGLWADPKAVPPWDWRDRQKSPAKEALANVPVVPNGVEIVALLPNPNGTDEGNEQVTISNTTDQDVDLVGPDHCRELLISLPGNLSPVVTTGLHPLGYCVQSLIVVIGENLKLTVIMMTQHRLEKIADRMHSKIGREIADFYPGCCTGGDRFRGFEWLGGGLELLPILAMFSQ